MKKKHKGGEKIEQRREKGGRGQGKPPEGSPRPERPPAAGSLGHKGSLSRIQRHNLCHSWKAALGKTLRPIHSQVAEERSRLWSLL